MQRISLPIGDATGFDPVRFVDIRSGPFEHTAVFIVMCLPSTNQAPKAMFVLR